MNVNDFELIADILKGRAGITLAREKARLDGQKKREDEKKRREKERAKKTAIRIPKLIDCKIHLTDNELLGGLNSSNEAVGKAKGGGPPRPPFGLGFRLLHVILLVLRRQGCGDRARLDTAAVEPAGFETAFEGVDGLRLDR